MPNPWLSVPLADYEGHMDSPEVHQLSALSELFAEALAFCRPESVAVLGIAGGNGLRHIDRAITKRIVGLDVNPSYLAAVRGRYAHACLELHCVDLAEHRVDLEPVQMVHAALVFEHAGVGVCLENALSLVAPGGALSVVLQLPTETGQNVSTSRFPSMQALRSGFTLIEPIWLRRILEEREFRLTHETERSLPAGKGFWMGVFRQAEKVSR
jgi:threonine dehydrogenase-like Zn-dependent dehydrogenase